MGREIIKIHKKFFYLEVNFTIKKISKTLKWGSEKRENKYDSVIIIN